LTNNSEKSNRNKILPTNIIPKHLQCTPPDQANHNNKPRLDANGRLKVMFNDVLNVVSPGEKITA